MSCYLGHRAAVWILAMSRVTIDRINTCYTVKVSQEGMSTLMGL